MKRCLALLVALLSIITPRVSWSYDHHFYRASNFFAEPRLERDWLTTLEAWLQGGSTQKGRGDCGKIVPVFDIWGLSNMRVLGNGVPDKDPTNLQDLTLINLAMLPANGRFAKFSIPGTFSLIELDINLYQNFNRGFFGQVYMPIRRLDANPCKFVDLSPDQCCPSKESFEWQEFLSQFNAILTRYNLSIAQQKHTNIGDTTLFVGWTNNYQETTVLDFIDTTLKAGILIPTGHKKNQNCVFDIASGYDGHVGFPVIGDMSFGAYEWFTLGLHAEVLVFLSRNRELRLKTDLQQSGVIKLAQDQVKYDMGPLWSVGTYAKADHLGPVSLIVGYSYARKEHDTVCPCNCDIFSSVIANTDEQLASWQMHTIHLLLEYDATRENSWWGPRIGFTYNAQVGGRRVFKTNTVGGYVGIDLAWNY